MSIFDLISPENVNTRFNYGESENVTALLVACVVGDYDNVVKLIGYGADLNMASSTECTPLIAACYQNNTKIVNYLLKTQKIKNINHCQIDSTTALSCAIKNKNTYVVKKLLEYPGINVNQKDIYGYTPLIEAFAEHAQKIINLLLPLSDLTVTCNRGVSVDMYYKMYLVTKNPKLIDTVTDEAYLCYIIRHYPFYIRFLSNPSTTVQLQAVVSNVHSYKYISQPAEYVSLAALSSLINKFDESTKEFFINIFPAIIFGIKNPSQHLQNVVVGKHNVVKRKLAPNTTCGITYECIGDAEAYKMCSKKEDHVISFSAYIQNAYSTKKSNCVFCTSEMLNYIFSNC